ncbi:DUF6571 family protein [Streptomyces monashensis]|uniref:DUF6571 family protein n=1 Tax=Streptomyces monashensis TaxID=1678012 RepID=UPI0033FE1B63
MPTYHEILTADLSTLTTAAERWDGMAKDFNKQETAYRRDVHGITLRPTFAGESQQAANARFSVRLTEFQSAQTEAKAIASLLRETHTRFVDLRKKLESARDDAIAKGMKVSDQGVVSLDDDKLTTRDRQRLATDTDYGLSMRKSVTSWQAHIDQCVKDVDDADKGVEVAFTTVVKGPDMGDGTVPGFNGKAQGDIDKYEAQEADDIARRVAKGEKVSPADLAELRRTFRDNKGDKAFSQTFLNGLGPDNTIKFTNALNDLAYSSDKSHENVYMDLQSALADTVANATQVPGSVADMPPGSPKFKAWLDSADGAFYRQWTQELEKYGTKNYGSKSNPLCGYQSFVSMMQHSDTKYDDQFLYQMGDDLIAADKTHSGLFTEWGPGHDGIRADALDGLLAVMSQNPDAATHFLDPAGNGSGADHVGNDHLNYLLDSRQWPKHVLDGVGYSETDESLSHTGLGAALEAATTGQAPGGYHSVGQHTEPQARILQHTIDTLNSVNQAKKLPTNLTLPLAHILTAYTPDTHEINAQSDSRFELPPGSTGSTWSDKDGAHITVARDSLTKLMRGIANDPTAFGHVYAAEQHHAHDLLAALPQDASKTVISNRITDCSRAMGAYDGVRADIIFGERFNKTQWSADFNHGLSSSLSTALMFKPKKPEFLGMAGDMATRALDLYTYESNKEHIAEANLKATEDNVKLYAAGQHDVENMVRMWGQSRGNDINSDWTKQYVHVGQQDYNYGRDRALDVLRADR